MKKQLFIFFLLIPFIVFSQQKYTIQGFVTDQNSGEALIGATVFIPELLKGTTTNNYGFFSLTVNPGKLYFQAKYIGYADSVICINLSGDTILNFKLTTNLIIEDVEIKGQKNGNSTSSLSGLSKQTMDLPMFSRMPVIAGEKDLLKSLQYLPGIKAGREGATSFNVRGGGNDQNLILLDGVPVYNVSHLMGFFSVFNNDAIKNADIYKGGIPARYGGKLSSVLDISMKEGNLYDAGGIVSISPVSARISFESPIKTEKSAFMVSYRRSFIDLPMRFIQKLAGENGGGAYFFHDFNGKANWKINDNNRIYFSTYFGKDKFAFYYKEGDHKSKGEYNWGNVTSVLRWNKIISKQMFANFSAYFSQFQHFQSSGNKEGATESLFTITSKLRDGSFNADFDYYPNPNVQVKFGLKYSAYQFSPNIQYVKQDNGNISPVPPLPDLSHEFSSYMENSFSIRNFQFNLGIRQSAYNADTKNYLYLQPRFSAKYQSPGNFSLSTTYTEMVQFMHLLTNSSLGLPTDLWVTSTDKTPPQKARQISMGFSSDYLEKFRFEVETYYKWMNNVIQFDEGTAYLNTTSNNWEENIVSGEGRAYGVELMTEKKVGKITGLASYTLSWSERKFDELNSGNWFPFKYDRRHDFSLLTEFHFVEKYQRKKSLSFGLTVQSGNHLSIPDTEIKGFSGLGLDANDNYWQTRQTFNNPNNFKMPAFHHLDIAYNIEQKKTASKSIIWSFSIYNVYNRLNPWFYYKEDNAVKQYSVFPFMPSISFTYKW